MSAYELNRLMYDLREPENRDLIRADIGGYLDRYDLEARERQLVIEQDWQGLVDAGVSVYVLTKIGATLDVSLYEMGAAMRGVSIDEFWAFVGEQNAMNEHYIILP